MLTKNYEIFNLYTIFLRLQIIFFDQHQNIDLIECQLEMFLFGLYYLQCHKFFVLVVVGLDDITERPTAQAFYQFVPITNMVMFSPHVVAL